MLFEFSKGLGCAFPFGFLSLLEAGGGEILGSLNGIYTDPNDKWNG